MKIMLTSHTRRIGGQELQISYAELPKGFRLSLMTPLGAGDLYATKIKQGAESWAKKAVDLPLVVIDQAGREIAITGEGPKDLIEAYLESLPNELQNAFVAKADEPAKEAPVVAPASEKPSDAAGVGTSSAKPWWKAGEQPKADNPA